MMRVMRAGSWLLLAAVVVVAVTSAGACKVRGVEQPLPATAVRQTAPPGAAGQAMSPEVAQPAAASRAAPPEARIPGGPVPVALPLLDGKLARRVQSAAAFVTVAPDGTLAIGALAPGPAPYAGQPVGNVPLDEALFPPPVAADAGPGSAGPPAEGSGSAEAGRDTGWVQTTAADDDYIQLGSRPGSGAAPKGDGSEGGGASYPLDSENVIGSLSGETTESIWGSLDDDDDHVRGGVFGASLDVQVQGELVSTGALDALVLADATGAASHTIEVLDALAVRRTSIATAGNGAPDAVPYRFTTPARAWNPTAVTVVFRGAELRVTEPRRAAQSLVELVGGVVPRGQLVSALRPEPRLPVPVPVHVVLELTTTVQQLVGVLGALAEVGATEVYLTSPNRRWGGGFGTIGYGRLGREAGVDHGDGRGRPRPPLGGAPTVSLGRLKASGKLSRELLLRIIKRRLPRITYCYEKELLAKPALAGKLTARFAISPAGTVSSSSVTGVDTRVASCVADVLKGTEFPSFKSGSVQVTVPFTLRPGGG